MMAEGDTSDCTDGTTMPTVCQRSTLQKRAYDKT